MRPSRSLPVLAAIALVTLTAATAADTRYTIAPAQSAVTAKVAFFGLASKTARFPTISGTATIASRDPGTLALDVSIDARALQAPDKVTLERLRGEKFFWVERYPTVRFAGRGMKMDTATTGRIAGDLTARGLTRPVTLAVRFARDPRSVPLGEPLAITGETTIDRRDFGMTAYPLIVGRKVTIRITARMEAD